MAEEGEVKKPIHKKWWFWVVIIVIILVGIAGASESNKNSTTSTTNFNKPEVTVADFSTMSKDATQAWFTTNKINGKISEEYSNDITKGNFVSQSVKADTIIHEGDKITVIYSIGKEPTTEEKNALKKAESYAKNMHMSKQGIYQQLTSEYGEKFPASAAQYAIDNIDIDWNANALAKAKSYQSNMNMSKQRIYDQLISQYGEKFTKEEAQYAIDHLDD